MLLNVSIEDCENIKEDLTTPACSLRDGGKRGFREVLACEQEIQGKSSLLTSGAGPTCWACHLWRHIWPHALKEPMLGLSSAVYNLNVLRSPTFLYFHFTRELTHFLASPAEEVGDYKKFCIFSVLFRGY